MQNDYELDLIEHTVVGPTKKAKLVLPRNDHMAITIRGSGKYYENDLLTAIRDLGVSGTYVDVGAHYGNHTVFFGLECKAEHIVAIEQHPDNFAGLMRNCEINNLSNVVSPRGVAIHPLWSRVKPIMWPAPDAKGTINTGMADIEQGNWTDMCIPGTTLDELLLPMQKIALIKIDVWEGRSLEAIVTATRILARDRPVVAAEVLGEDNLAVFHGFMRVFGYDFGPRYGSSPTFIWQPVGFT